jgi:4-hydroxybenzoate polyprenyltransferase
MKKNKVVYVDLDGTFIRNDLFVEAVGTLLLSKPWMLFQVLVWSLRGIAHLKYKMSQLKDFNPKNLNLNTDMLEKLITYKKEGHEIVLATGSASRWAKAVTNEFPVFDRFMSSDERLNLVGEAKLSQILLESNQFIYFGNSRADKKILSKAVGGQIIPSPFRWTNLFKVMRPYHWVKNVLVLVPLFTSHVFFATENIYYALVGFCAFSLLASSVYIFNDILDLESDRLNDLRKSRPIANGSISLIQAGLLVFTLLAIAFSIISHFFHQAISMAVCYILLNWFYSVYAKKILGLDLVLLASFYIIRVLFGSLILNLETSNYLLLFILFSFVGMTLVKRVSDLISEKKSLSSVLKTGRGYIYNDVPVLISGGVACSMISLLVLTEFIQSLGRNKIYTNPDFLWVLVPLFLFWHLRLWIFAQRGDVKVDPVLFVLKDRASLAVFSVALLVFSFSV